MTKRHEWVVTAKGLGIILVVAGHAGLPDLLESWVFAFHIPLFFFLSGLTLNTHKYKSFREFALGKFNKLIVPYMLFAAFSLVFQVIYWHLIVGRMRYDLQASFAGILWGTARDNHLLINTALWFLPCLYVSELLFYFVSRQKQFTGVVTVTALAVVGFALGDARDFYLPWGIEIALVAQLFIYAGAQVKPLLLNLKLRPVWFWLIPLMLLIITAVTVIQGKPDVSFAFYRQPALFLAGAAAGIVLITVIVKLAAKDPLTTEIGRNSLYYFGLHLQVLFAGVEVALLLTGSFKHLLTADVYFFVKAAVTTVVVLLLLYLLKTIVIAFNRKLIVNQS